MRVVEGGIDVLDRQKDRIPDSFCCIVWNSNHEGQTIDNNVINCSNSDERPFESCNVDAWCSHLQKFKMYFS